MNYILQGAAARWFDVNYFRWVNYTQFISEFKKVFGSSATDHQIIIEISTMKMKPEDNVTEFVLKIQQKYRAMQRLPPVAEQVKCIRNHLTDDLRTLVFARPVSTYEDLLNAQHEATRCLEEARQPTIGSELQGKPQFNMIRLSPDYVLFEEDEIKLSSRNLMEPESPEIFKNKYGVQTRRTNNYRHQFNSSQDQIKSQQYYQQIKQVPRSKSRLGKASLAFPRFTKPCFNCGIYGNLFRACINPRRNVCNICFKVGHLRHDCSQLVREDNNLLENSLPNKIIRSHQEDEDSPGNNLKTINTLTELPVGAGYLWSNKGVN